MNHNKCIVDVNLVNKFKQTLSIFYYAFCQTEKNVYQINIHYMYFLEQMR